MSRLDFMILFGIICFPFVVYFSVKLGRYAYLQANELFEHDHHKECQNGCRHKKG